MIHEKIIVRTSFALTRFCSSVGILTLKADFWQRLITYYWKKVNYSEAINAPWFGLEKEIIVITCLQEDNPEK